jgi:hypothetical protein
LREDIVNENELRAAMRVATTTAPPPEMSSAAALTAGRRAVRRRTALTGAGAAAGLVAVTALAVNLGVPLLTGSPDDLPAGAAAAPTPTPTAGAVQVHPSGGAAPTGENTDPVWPTDGSGQPQEDATARSGERYEQAKTLLGRVLSAVPDGWTTPTGQAVDGSELRYHQAQVEGDNTGATWGYMAHAAVQKGGRTGRLLAEVHTRNNGLPTEPCALAQQFWGMQGECEVVTVGRVKVGVVVEPATDRRFDQWAAYRHPDGVVVYVGQSRNASNAGTSSTSLKELPFPARDLAALATDEGFHLE